jgi:hypothetical protein
MIRVKRVGVTLLALALLHGSAPAPRAAETVGQTPPETGAGLTPPRLSYAEGEASFWRPGAQDWAPVQVNTPLAPGDELYTGHEGHLEVQVGTRAYARAWGDTQLGLTNQEQTFLQLRVASGHVSLDLRSLDAGQTIELGTPHAAFTIERPGYYRADVTAERTAFVARRGGRAVMTSAKGQAASIAPSEEVVLEGTPLTAQTYAARELDVWDRWNYARTDQLLESVSARYVPPGVYGVDDLDHHGTWRVVPTYGAVWVPDAVSAGWVPYSTGKWIWDPHYGWTWVDTALWGWAPYHHGRWVVVNGVWAWAPGPVVARAVYAPALVAFFGAPGVQVTVGAPVVSWVALGWGEPIVPWWGRGPFVGRAWWGGWGGPRIVNNVAVSRTTVVNVTNITVYRNLSVQNAVVVTRQDAFGRRPVQETRVTQVDVRRLEPVHGAPRVKPDASSFVVAGGQATRPPAAVLAKPVVATRPAAAPRAVPRADPEPRAAVNVPAPRVVTAPRPVTPTQAPRPPFGDSPVERRRPPEPQRLEPEPRPDTQVTPPVDGARRPSAAQPVPRERPDNRAKGIPHSSNGPRDPSPSPHHAGRQPDQGPPERVEAPRPSRGQLPGEPASRVFPGRSERSQPGPGGGPGSGGGPGPGEGRGPR